jgi:hypothetical protein
MCNLLVKKTRYLAVEGISQTETEFELIEVRDQALKINTVQKSVGNINI